MGWFVLLWAWGFRCTLLLLGPHTLSVWPLDNMSVFQNTIFEVCLFGEYIGFPERTTCQDLKR